MQCCVRHKYPQCAHCGAFVDVHRARTVLYYGIILRFCNQDCISAFVESWRAEVRKSTPLSTGSL